jgi:tetratricopeptide (TPR) repeat protein
LSRLAIFPGDWDQVAVEAICAQITGQTTQGDGTGNAWPFLAHTVSPALLAALVDKTLVRREPGELQSFADTAPRFRLLEPIREYALEQLTARGETTVLARAHAAYYLALAEAATAQWISPNAHAAITQLDAERDNLRAALQWARDGGDPILGLRLAGALVKFWRRRGALHEGRTWLEELLALNVSASDAPTLRVRLAAMQGAAWLASDQHDYARATQLFEQSMALRSTQGERADNTNLLINAAIQARTAGEYARATALLEEALAQQRALGNCGSLSNFGLGLSFFLLGMVQREQGNFAQATGYYAACIELHRTLGDGEGVAIGLLGLSDVARDQGDIAQTQQYATESLASLRQLDVQWAIGYALNNLAQAAYRAGDLVQALALINETTALFRTQKAEGSLAEALITHGQIVQAQGDRAAARTILSEALQIAWRMGPRLLVAAILEAQADLAAQPDSGQQGATQAARLLAVAATLRRQMDAPVRPVDLPVVEHALATTRATLGAATFAAVWSAVETASPEEIVNVGAPGDASIGAGPGSNYAVWAHRRTGHPHCVGDCRPLPCDRLSGDGRHRQNEPGHCVRPSGNSPFRARGLSFTG